MLFNSYIFALFAIVVFGLYFAINDWAWRKRFLLVMSYLFYGAWNLPYLVLIWFSTGLDYFSAQRMARANRKSTNIVFLAISLIGNLGVLSYFKYGNFLLDSFISVAAVAGIQYEPMPWSILLPVGISFYTFQTLSYTLDVYRGRLKPSESLTDFALFVTFFPQLVAGPIVRARSFLPQLVEPLRVNSEKIGWGLILFVLGLFQKVVIADGIMAPVVNTVFAAEGYLPSFTVLAGMVGFTIQMYCDFSGYSMMAIGLALCLGFKLPRNFRAPFSAVGYQDFWRRWHISLSTFFRDYLYAPIRRQAKSRTLTNILIAQFFTFFVIGLWHGASWNFALWGVFNAVIIVIEIGLQRLIGHWKVWKLWFWKYVFNAVGYVLFLFSILLFRAADFERASDLFMSFLLPTDNPLRLTPVDWVLLIPPVIAVFFLHHILRDRSFETIARATPISLRVCALTSMLLAIILFGQPNEEFIYFQF